MQICKYYKSLLFLSFSTIFIERIEMVSYNERVLMNDFYQVKCVIKKSGNELNNERNDVQHLFFSNVQFWFVCISVVFKS